MNIFDMIDETDGDQPERETREKEGKK